MEDMVRQTQCLDKTKYKVLLIWDSECNCDVGWITVRKTCEARKLEQQWRDSRFEVRDWNLDTEPDIVINAVDVKDVSDEIDTNMEIVLDTTMNGILKTACKVFNEEEIVIGNKDKDENVNKSNIVRDDFSISVNMDTKVKIEHESHESS